MNLTSAMTISIVRRSFCFQKHSLGLGTEPSPEFVGSRLARILVIFRVELQRVLCLAIKDLLLQKAKDRFHHALWVSGVLHVYLLSEW